MRVLLVEDEMSFSRYIRKGLEEEGYAVDAAADGQEALDAIQVSDYDIVLLDIMIPRISGIEVCKRIRERRHQPSIIMLTALGGIEERIHGLDTGADDYLVKPFAFDELLARIRAVTRRSRDSPRSPILEVADLRMDTVTKKVQRGSVAYDLPTKEYAVLECLMREPERVFTREQIVEHVWDANSFTESNVIDVYIRNLRRKIDDPFPIKLISTIRGTGYRISGKGGHETA
jgi:DNA-binding response OmpR family regulator